MGYHLKQFWVFLTRLKSHKKITNYLLYLVDRETRITRELRVAEGFWPRDGIDPTSRTFSDNEQEMFCVNWYQKLNRLHIS